MNYFILHGHFYQPPRENPWTGFIDRQESAYPYGDWNKRILAECYSSSTRTPVFENNEIVKIVNCYEYLSFNIGPTLLSWMQNINADPFTIEKIIEGDKLSQVRNNGHGNAIAQIYSHMIMPLASEKDQYTQILWGLQDFEKFFKRESEGIWLGETAINNETAAILVDNGIKYVILSPYQAKNIINGKQSLDVLGGKVDPSTPYKLHTKNGDLAVFFYDPFLASEISFGNALTNAENLHGMVNNALNQQQKPVKLVHTATDGEVYGHHKSFGNMALARLIYNVTTETNANFEFTNYGAFLEMHPPTQECELYLGEKGEGSSWSCAHGVGRWIRDCSCQTGGDPSWNQKWRTPLRDALDKLRDSLYSIAEKYTEDTLIDVWDARNDYYKPITLRTEESYEYFFNKHQKKTLNDKEKQHVLSIMEALRYEMLMYTSCGWFFSDISGIETIQILLYAYRAYEFSKDLLPADAWEEFEKTLLLAISNTYNNVNGEELLKKSISTYKINNDSFFEYICWSIVSQNEYQENLSTNEFLIDLEHADLEKNQFIIRFVNTVGEKFKIACTLNKDTPNHNNELLWKHIDVSLENNRDIWDSDDNSWKFSFINNLPLFLRVRFIEQYTYKGLKYCSKIKNVDTNPIFLNAVWGAENLLLPYEKEILSFHFLSHIHEFTNSIVDKEDLNMLNMEPFIKEIEILKNVVSSDKEASFQLESIIRVFNGLLQKVLEQKNTHNLREVRMLFWTIKKYIDPLRLDILRHTLYDFHIKEGYLIKEPSFNIELNTIMRDMGFSLK